MELNKNRTRMPSNNSNNFKHPYQGLLQTKNSHFIQPYPPILSSNINNTTSKNSVHTNTSNSNHSNQSSSSRRTNNSNMLLSDDDSGCPIEEYAWTPPGCTPKQVQQYFSGWPEELIPYVESPGDRYRCCQLLKQLPPQDNEIRYCSNLDSDEKQELLLFAKERKDKALGRATVRAISIKQNLNCEGCKQPLDNLAVFASKNGFDTCWHPQCFKCSTCQELLVDLIFFADGKQLYCGRHHAEKLKPRCSNCDEIIFCEECTEAEGLFWHTHHFVCSTCNCALGGQRYIMRDQKPYCTNCFEADYAVKCSGCSDMIGLHVGQVEYGGQSWHADSKCFKCEFCSEPLLNRSFLPKFGYVYCSHKCAVRFEQHQNKVKKQQLQNNQNPQQNSQLPFNNQLPSSNSAYEYHKNNLQKQQTHMLNHNLNHLKGNTLSNSQYNQNLISNYNPPVTSKSNQPHNFYNKSFENNTLNLNSTTSNSNLEPLYESINLGRDLNILPHPEDLKTNNNSNTNTHVNTHQNNTNNASQHITNNLSSNLNHSNPVAPHNLNHSPSNLDKHSNISESNQTNNGSYIVNGSITTNHTLNTHTSINTHTTGWFWIGVK